MQRDQRRLNANCISEMLSFSLQIHSRIGALCFVEQGHAPHYAAGIALEQLHDAEQTAQNIDQQDFASLDINAMSLVYLANSGSGVGGARPKALVHAQGIAYLAKFNRSTDLYNNARVELACLLMAQGAGINIGHGKIISDINQRDVLLLERFDTLGNARRHLITANDLLKPLCIRACSKSLYFQYIDSVHRDSKYTNNAQHVWQPHEIELAHLSQLSAVPLHPVKLASQHATVLRLR